MNLPIEMYKKYVERRKDDSRLLQQALDAGSIDAFKRIGHQIRGNAGSFGFEDLVSLGNRMEGVSDQTLDSEGREIISILNDWVIKKEKEFAD